MNRRHKKKFEKKYGYKKYGIIHIMQSVINDDGTVDLLSIEFHNGSGKVRKATRYVNVVPVGISNSLDIKHSVESNEMTVTFDTEPNNDNELVNQASSVMMEMYNTWMKGISDESKTEKEI